MVTPLLGPKARAVTLRVTQPYRADGDIRATQPYRARLNGNGGARQPGFYADVEAQCQVRIISFSIISSFEILILPDFIFDLGRNKRKSFSFKIDSRGDHLDHCQFF